MTPWQDQIGHSAADLKAYAHYQKWCYSIGIEPSEITTYLTATKGINSYTMAVVPTYKSA